MHHGWASPREGSKISSETPDEPLIPEPGRLPGVGLPEIRGIGPGIGLLLLATLAAWLLRPFLAAPVFTLPPRVFVEHSTLIGAVALINLLIFYALPQLVAIVMLWIAFISADRGDRYLWSAAMILTAGIVAWLLDAVILPPAVNSPLQFLRMPSGSVFANVSIVSGSAAYAAVYFAFARGGYRALYGGLALVALSLLYVVPLILGYVSWLTALCSLLVSGGIWSLGVYIAERAGFDPYTSDERDQ